MRKGQLSMPVHWIYVLVAGAAILLFFIGIVVKQKDVSENKLSATVSEKLEGIFAGASVGDDETVFTPAIPLSEVGFSCDNGYSAYKVGKVATETIFQPIFGPQKVKTSQLVLWRMNFDMPFKVTDLLMVGSSAINYYIVYNENIPGAEALAHEIQEVMPAQLNMQVVGLRDFKNTDTGIASYAKVIVLGDTPEDFIPAKLQNYKIIRLSLDKKYVFYPEQTSLIGGFSRKNAALYASFFVDDAESYDCNMAKAYKRMRVLADIYRDRAVKIRDSYGDILNICKSLFNRAIPLVDELIDETDNCIAGNCNNLHSKAAALKEHNQKLLNQNCPTVY